MSVFRALTGCVAVVILSSIGLLACGDGPESPELATPVATLPAADDTPEPTELTPSEAQVMARISETPDSPSAPEEADDPPAFSPAQATGAVRGIPAPTNTAPIVAVANYFGELPGIDLTVLSPHQKEKFLHRVNSELCTCGCKDDTLARCYVNDPSCPLVKGMLLTVLDEVKGDQ